MTPSSSTISQAKTLLQHSLRLRRLYADHLHGRDGENFNLFQLLGIEHLEVSTHSRILRDLLDPLGSHVQGTVFLERFFVRCGLPAFDFKKAVISPEIGIGPVTDVSGGRLDLAISDGSRKLVLIENKIFAQEQNNWVTRYLDHAPGGTLVFLTLYGDEPKELKQGHRPANLVCASYRTHITNWLQDCRKEAASAPIVRESITQYLHLVQELTNQNRFPYMNDELVKTAIENRDSLEAYFSLCRVEQQVQTEIVKHLQTELDRLANDLGFTFSGSPNQDYSARGSGFDFTKPDMRPRGVRIRFEFDKKGYEEFAFGFVDDGKLPASEREILQSLFAKEYGKPLSNPSWPAWIYWGKYRNWSSQNVFAEIRFGNFLNDISMELKRLNQIFTTFSATCISQKA